MRWFRSRRQSEEPTCDVCRQPLKLGKVSLVSWAGREVEVVFRDLPLLVCENEGHPRRYAIADFGLYAIDAVFWRGQVPLGRPGAMARVKCYQCGKNISKVPVQSGEVTGLLKISGVPEFGIRIKGPVATCPRCRTDQLWASREVGRAVSSAMVKAFKEAGL